MGRKQSDPGRNARVLILALAALASCFLVYTGLTVALRRPIESSSAPITNSRSVVSNGEEMAGRLLSGDEVEEEEEGGCCRGVERLELWGSAVKWGTDHKFNSSRECCRSCKAMCRVADGPCLCYSWVFCGDRERCGEKFGECWLKKQKDVLFPALQESGEKVIWTSGLIFGKGEGIVGLETDHGTLHIKLLPECAPRSVAYIIELLGSRHCAGCQLYRAEGRGNSWDSKGNRIADASLGPPYALIQGRVEAEGIPFKNVPVEACPTIRQGSVAWVGSGPEFIISLADHEEWRRAYTVFGSVLPEGMDIAEKIAGLPTRSDVWSNINVSVLEKPIPLRLRGAMGNPVGLNFDSSANSGSGQS